MKRFIQTATVVTLSLASAAAFSQTASSLVVGEKFSFGSQTSESYIYNPVASDTTRTDTSGASITVGITPAPFVSAKVTEKGNLYPFGNTGDPYYGTSNAAGDLLYQFTIQGTANARIPVGFSGIYSLSSTFKNTFGNDFSGSLPYGHADAIFSVAQTPQGYVPSLPGFIPGEQLNWDATAKKYADLYLVSCEFTGPDACGSLTKINEDGRPTTIGGTWSATGVNSYAGAFSGQSSFLADGSGIATVTVYMQANVFYKPNAAYFYRGEISSFINPVFTVDENWLKTEGNFARINMPENVGNASVSLVPEPETYAMMLVGLGVMGAIARRRKSRLTA